MKKKLIAFLCALIACLGMLFAFTACDNGLPSTTESLTFGKKYIYDAHVSREAEKQRYYIFNSNGTGQFHYYYADEDQIEHYTIDFKYTFADNEKSAVICFYDSVTYASDHTEEKSEGTFWDTFLGISKNVLTYTGTYGFSYYICEDYLPEIPNYGK